MKENFRLNITQQEDPISESKTYDINFGSISDESINISKISDDIFNVSLPSGEVKTYKVKSSGIVEINSSGEEISDSFLIESGSNEFFSFLLLQLHLLQLPFCFRFLF